jgi:VWFA-related protein
MRAQTIGTVAALLLAVTLPAAGPDQIPYKIAFDPDRDVRLVDEDERGKPGLFIQVQFKITREGRLATGLGKDYWILIEEDGKRVGELQLPPLPRPEDLTTVLALDISGSMSEQDKIGEAKKAARTFLDKLDPRADCGLILFNHQIQASQPPVRDRRRFADNRDKLWRIIQKAEPDGGTAYLDATARAVQMVADIKGRRVVLVMTDGVDLNSEATLADVVAAARKYRVPVYTLGVGEPGKKEPVLNVLVLDHSGSMEQPASEKDTRPKIVALHKAAAGFVRSMRPTARTSLLPFSSAVEAPGPFTNRKQDLKKAIESLRAYGETALFDATYAALATLEAERGLAKRSVVVLTDGIDNSSRRRVDEVIERAKQAKIALHMLGFGRPGELDEKVMRAMATQTGGKYYHAKTEDELVKIFEDLSIQLHDEGIDEETLKALAEQTGGKYYPARKIGELKFIYQRLAEELQKTYQVTVPSLRPKRDGTARRIDVKLVRKVDGAKVQVVKSLGETDRAVRGVVVAEMDYEVYLGLLGGIVLLLVLPGAIRGLVRSGKRADEERL